jgi:hypothetical protein
MGIDLIGDTALFGEYNAQAVLQNFEREEWGLRNKAVEQRAQGKFSQQQGYINAFGTVLSTAASISNPRTFGGSHPNFFSPTGA